MSPTVRTVLGWGATALGLLLAAGVLLSQSSRADWKMTELRWGWLCAALACAASYVMLYAALWLRLAESCGLALGRRQACGIYLTGLALKYLPSGVAGMGYRVWAYHRAGGWPIERVASSVYGETVLVLVSGAMVAIGFTPLVPWPSLMNQGVRLMLMATAPLSLLAVPAFARLLLRMAPGSRMARSFEAIVGGAIEPKAIARYAVAWLVLGAVLALTLRGIVANAGSGLELWITSTWAYAVAGIAGMVVMVAPAGLGVRDALLALALGSVIPAPQAALGAVAARCISLIAEMTCALAGRLLLTVPRPRDLP